MHRNDAHDKQQSEVKLGTYSLDVTAILPLLPDCICTGKIELQEITLDRPKKGNFTHTASVEYSITAENAHRFAWMHGKIDQVYIGFQKNNIFSVRAAVPISSSTKITLKEIGSYEVNDQEIVANFKVKRIPGVSVELKMSRQ